MCITGNAAGERLPLFTVYKAKHLYSSWCVGGVEAARYAVSHHGWMERALFKDYFKNLFLPESAKYSVPNFPRILIFDGHASHISLELAKMAEENNVKLLRLPSQLTLFSLWIRQYFERLKGSRERNCCVMHGCPGSRSGK